MGLAIDVFRDERDNMEDEGKVYEDRGRTTISGRFCFLAPCVCWRIFKPLNWFTYTYTHFGLTRALSVFTMRLFNGLASLLAGAGLAQATLQIVSGGTWSAVRNKHSPSPPPAFFFLQLQVQIEASTQLISVMIQSRPTQAATSKPTAPA